MNAKMWTRALNALYAVGVALAFVLFALHPQYVGFLALGATTDTTALNAAMKVIFADPLITNVVTDTELMSLFKTDMNVKSDETTGGRYIEMAQYFQLPSGVGARGENDYVPVPQNPVFANSRILLKKVQGVVEMTGDTMRRVMSGEGAFISYMQRALPDLATRVVNEVDRMYIGYGAGIKARVLTKTDATHYIVDRSLGVTGYQDPFLQFLENESVVFSATAAGTALRNAGSGQSFQITAIDEGTNTLTFAANAPLDAAVVVNDYIFAGDAAGTSSQNSGVDREIAGLLAGVDDGNILATYNNIVRSGNRLWQSIVIDGSASPWGGLMSEDLLTFADDEVFIKGGGRTNAIVMSRPAARGYWKSLKSDRFFMDPKSYVGGKAGLTIILGDRNLPLKIARKLPPQVVFGLTTDYWRRFTLGQWEWDDKTGAIWNRVTDATGRKDAFYAVGNMYEQLFCTAPRKNFRIDGLTKAS